MERDFYQLDMATGSIIDQRGAILYEADSIEAFSLAAKVRLAQLHSIDPDLQWEGVGLRKGAWDILIEEGLAEEPAP